MLLRISLIVAILAGLGAGVVSYLEISDKIPALVQQRDNEQNLKKDALAKLDTTEKNLKKTQTQLAQTQQELTDTKGERDKAVAQVETLTTRANELTDKLGKTTKERDDALNEVASYKASGLTPDQVFKLNKNLKDAYAEIEVVNGEKTILLHKVAKLQNELERYFGTNPYVMLRPDLHGKVTAVDPKWDFVVVNVGEEQGVLNDGELLVSRQGKLIGKIIVRSVQKDHSVANLVPGWKLGEIIEGDDISPAHPSS
jgi:hypothetical protein